LDWPDLIDLRYISDMLPTFGTLCLTLIEVKGCDDFDQTGVWRFDWYIRTFLIL